MQLENKVALITGAGSNVGRALAEMFRSEGARLALADLAPERLPRGADAEDCRIAADLTRAADCASMVERTMAAFGRIDVLCNTAGIDPPTATSLHLTSEADWDRIMAVNVKGVFLACKYVLPAMLEQRSGAIVNVASQGAIRALPNLAAYGASKAAVLQLTRQIAADYGRHGIRANCVCPSGLEQPSLDRRASLDAEKLARRSGVMREAVPLGEVCTPLDVARAMLFLASDAARFVTGVALPVDGGATAVIRL